MKSKYNSLLFRSLASKAAHLSLPLATALAALLSVPAANATIYYWDQNGTTAGFGTAGGTWDTTGSSTWGDSVGTAAIVATTTLNTDAATDALNFGTAADGLGAGTIAAVGTVSAGDITFGSASGAIVLSGGTISLTAASTITVDNASDTISSVLSDAGTSLTKAGTGTLILSGSNSYSGATNINAGTLSTASFAQNGSNSGIGSGSTVNLNGGSLRYIGGNVGPSPQFNRAISVGAGGGTLDNAGSGFVFYSGTLSGSGALAFVDTSGDATARQWLVTGNSAGFSGAVSIGNGTANSGSAQHRSNAANPFGTGTITINGGGTLSADTGTTAPTGLSNAFIFNGGSLITEGPAQTYSGAVTVNANTTTSVGTIGSTGDIGLNGNISGSGTVTTVGTGGFYAVSLGGNNSGFTGTWQSTGGKTWFNNVNAGSAAAKWVANGRDFVANFGNGTISLGEISGTSGVLYNEITNTTATFSVGALNTNSTFSGGINNVIGTSALTKVGTGTLTLSGTNFNYTGKTTVSGGTLQVTGNLGSGNYGGAIDIASGATFQQGGGGRL